MIRGTDGDRSGGRLGFRGPFLVTFLSRTDVDGRALTSALGRWLLDGRGGVGLGLRGRRGLAAATTDEDGTQDRRRDPLKGPHRRGSFEPSIHRHSSSLTSPRDRSDPNRLFHVEPEAKIRRADILISRGPIDGLPRGD